MKLYVTQYSPYARMARVVLREKALQSRVEEVIAQTRLVNSPYYEINPSGRVPYLVRSDGVGMEGSSLICDYLDNIDQSPNFARPEGPAQWEFLRLEELARSLLEGISVWTRELLRPRDRSQAVIEHEIERTRRLLAQWDTEIASPLLQGQLNYIQIALTCALHLEVWNPYFVWRDDHPKLAMWLDEMLKRPSFKETFAPGPLSLT